MLRKRNLLSRVITWEFALLALLIIELAVMTSVLPGFADLSVLLSSSTTFLSEIVAALALTLPIISGGIDLSVGSVASFSAVLVGVLYKAGIDIWLVIILALIGGLVVGLINGIVIVKSHVDPFIVTLGSLFAFASLASFIEGTAPPVFLPSSFAALSSSYVFGVIPSGFIYVIIAGIVLSLVLHRTVFGRYVVLLGQNHEAARYAGLAVNRTIINVYMISGFLAALAGVVGASEFGATRVGVGSDLLLPAITIVVLGGVNIFGGAGSVFGVMISGLLVGYLGQGLLSFNLTPIIVQMVIGVLLLAVFAIKSMQNSASIQAIFMRMRISRATPRRNLSG